MCQKCEGDCGLWILNEIMKEKYPENMKKTFGSRFGSYLLNSTANPAQFEFKWTGLDVLFKVFKIVTR